MTHNRSLRDFGSVSLRDLGCVSLCDLGCASLRGFDCVILGDFGCASDSTLLTVIQELPPAYYYDRDGLTPKKT